MWTVFLAALPLLQPVAYLLAMIVIWACIPQRAPRIIVICAMALVPLGSAGHVVWRAWTMHEAERAFVEQCRASDSPTVHVKAAGVESLLVDQQARPASAGAAERHPQLVFPVKEAEGGNAATRPAGYPSRPPAATPLNGARSRPALSTSRADCW